MSGPIQGDFIADYLEQKYGIPKPPKPPDTRSWLARNIEAVFAAAAWCLLLLMVTDVAMGHYRVEAGSLLSKGFVPRHQETHWVTVGKIARRETSWYGPYYSLQVGLEGRTDSFENVEQAVWEACPQGRLVVVKSWIGWITGTRWNEWVVGPSPGVEP